jgi:predicted GIY-YIG superfamily endonuclease
MNFVYIIKGINDKNKTKFYIGYTNNLQRRIKQHNQIISGGAKATKGYKWEYYAIITNFRSHIEGLQLEWRLKHSTKKTGIINRLNSFLNYIDINKKGSPKSDKMKKKLIIYINNNNNLIKPINSIIININITNIIIEHLINGCYN